MRRRVKDGLREARLKVRASRADVASDLAYRLVPARIDVDVGTDCEDARAKRASDASTSDASSSVRLVAHYGLDHTASTVSYAEEQRLLVTTSAHGATARGGGGLECLYAVSRGEGSEGTCGRYVRGAARVYRCGVDGDVDVWDATDLRALASGVVDGGSSALECVRGTNFWLAGLSLIHI